MILEKGDLVLYVHGDKRQHIGVIREIDSVNAVVSGYNYELSRLTLLLKNKYVPMYALLRMAGLQRESAIFIAQEGSHFTFTREQIENMASLAYSETYEGRADREEEGYHEQMEDYRNPRGW